jgi:Cu2+-exporting ATPase
MPCEHCGSPTTDNARFCCEGCATVFALLAENGLGRYYALAGADVAPVTLPAPHGLAWLEPLLAGQETDGSVELDVQGIHCAACVWLLEELATRRGPARVVVNPVRGTLRLVWSKPFDVRAFVADVERFGYRLGAPRKDRLPLATTGLTLRLGIAAALTVNVMIFSVAFYTGLTPREGESYRLFSLLVFGLATAVVVVGGSLFFRSAWQSLRRGVVHLDVPIALGIALAYGASLVQGAGLRGDHAYLDTLSVFVTLMLLGRWLEERVLLRNRLLLLDDDGLGALVLERRRGARIDSVPAKDLLAGDDILFRPGDLLPVDATILEGRSAISREWVTGEPDIFAVAPGDRAAAGACNRGNVALWVRVEGTLPQSPIRELLAGAPDRTGIGAHERFGHILARAWVFGVLMLAALAFLVWTVVDRSRSIDITVALLVVTCPCAIGIAAPLARELVQARLRRAGFYARTRDVLARLGQVRRVAFDKTGTLTLGRLQLADSAPLERLSDDERDAVYALAVRSSHPRSRAIAAALHGASLVAVDNAVEEPGAGISGFAGGREIAIAAGSDGATSLTIGDRLPISLHFVEELRRDAASELRRLGELGLEVSLLSGDSPARVAEVAQRLNVSADKAIGGLSPADKAALVDSRTLVVGDGVNDTLAFAAAAVAGTPAVDRPVVPARADFFILGEGLSAVSLAVRLARRLDHVLRRNLVISLSYNAVAVSLCFAGRMTPLIAAVAMPLSSLSLIALTVTSLRRCKKEPS